MRIAVVALGKIGLPLAVQFAEGGHQVIGSDTNRDLVEQVNRGEEPFPGEAHLALKLASVVSNGSLSATTDTAQAVTQSEVIIVVVPLFVDSLDAPDFEWLDSATRDIGRGLQSGTLVVYETTLPVGTTRDRWKPLLEQVSGMTEGLDFDVAFSPERVLTGRVFADLRKYPKLVGGLTNSGGKRAVTFYESVLQFDARPDLDRDNGVWNLGSAEAAEMTKLAETTYRDVNIGLANQFAMFAASHGIDVHQVIEASNSQPFSHIHRPGIAVGGHCIPVYPRLYLWNHPSATIVQAARDVNSSMPDYVVNILRMEYGDLSGARVAVLGAAYRDGVKETAFSGVFATVRALQAQGALAAVHDPLYSGRELEQYGFKAYSIGEQLDAAIVQTDHHQYSRLTQDDLPGAQTIVDGRKILNGAKFQNVNLHVLGTGPSNITSPGPVVPPIRAASPL